MGPDTKGGRGENFAWNILIGIAGSVPQANLLELEALTRGNTLSETGDADQAKREQLQARWNEAHESS